MIADAARMPDGQNIALVPESLSSPFRKNIPLFSCANQNHISLSRPDEGRFAIVTNVGWDAVDAAVSSREAIAGRVSRERSAGAETNGADANGKTVWSWHPLLVSSRRRCNEPDRASLRLIRR